MDAPQEVPVNEALMRGLPYLIPVLLLLVLMRRSLRGRKLRAERLWLFPTLLAAGVALLLYEDPPRTMAGAGVLTVALAIGAAIGWWRGRFTQITIDPETHELTSRASIAGAVLIVAVFALRYALRMEEGAISSELHVSAVLITDAAMMLAMGIMGVQRLEMWLRCQRLLAEARAAKAVARN
jgi:hypothetical protein